MADETWMTAFEALRESGMNRDSYSEYLKEFDIIETYKSEMAKKSAYKGKFHSSMHMNLDSSKTPSVELVDCYDFGHEHFENCESSTVVPTKNAALQVYGEMPHPDQSEAHKPVNALAVFDEMPITLGETAQCDSEDLEYPTLVTEKIGAFTVFDEMPTTNSSLVACRDLTKEKTRYSDKPVKSSNDHALPGTLTIIIGPAQSAKNVSGCKWDLSASDAIGISNSSYEELLAGVISSLSGTRYVMVIVNIWDPGGFAQPGYLALDTEICQEQHVIAISRCGELYAEICKEFESWDELWDPGGLYQVRIWVYSIICSFGLKGEYVDTKSICVGALPLAILFLDPLIVQSSATIRIIPSIVFLLKSDEIIDKYSAAQAVASLVLTGGRGIQLTIANPGAIVGLITLLGYMESDVPNLVALSEEFNLPSNPDQVVLGCLFEIEDARTGATARKSIPLLVDLLRPMPDRPGAPPVAVRLQTRAEVAEGDVANKMAMAEAGALDALTKYLSLSPQDQTETAITDLLGILYSNPDLIHHEVSLSSPNQLVAVLRLSSRCVRFSATRTLQELFVAESLRDIEMARQFIQPLVDMLDVGPEREQHASLGALIKLTAGSVSKASALTDVEGDPLESLFRILSFSSSLELTKNAAQLCYVLFGNSNVQAMSIAFECTQPLISLMTSYSVDVVESGVVALERLLEDEHHANSAATYEVVSLLVGIVSAVNYQLSEASISALIKLGKDRPQCKLDMVNAGIIDSALEMLFSFPVYVCASIVELLRILTNISSIAKSVDAARTIKLLFLLLQRPDFTMWGQHSALQALVNILEKPQSLTSLKLTPSEVIGPLISFLEFPSQAIQQLSTELLSHLLEQKHFQQDITTKNEVVPLVQMAGIGILSLQQATIKALKNISMSWPKVVADTGDIFELSKVIVQDDPPAKSCVMGVSGSGSVKCPSIKLWPFSFKKSKAISIARSLPAGYRPKDFYTFQNIFVVGSDTSSGTIEWIMSELMRNPSAMKKVQDEVTSVVGNKGKVGKIELDQHLYLKCIVKEVMRLHPAVPLLLQRKTIHHCRINNYDISPRTRLFINSFAIGRDANVWKNSDKFHPERFIDSSIDFKGQDFGLIPFGTGRRICPGMNVGILVVELALVNFLYSFNWKLPTEISKDGIEIVEAPGLVVHRKSDLHVVAKKYK